jgi:hypothetical protein
MSRRPGVSGFDAEGCFEAAARILVTAGPVINAAEQVVGLGAVGFNLLERRLSDRRRSAETPLRAAGPRGLGAWELRWVT